MILTCDNKGGIRQNPAGSFDADAHIKNGTLVVRINSICALSGYLIDIKERTVGFHFDDGSEVILTAENENEVNILDSYIFISVEKTEHYFTFLSVDTLDPEGAEQARKF